jgi:hypothetical protein
MFIGLSALARTFFIWIARAANLLLNPTVTVLENTLGYTPSLSRNLAGQYEIGVTGTTIPMYSITENTTNINYVFRMTPSFNMGIYTIAIKTYDSGVATDGLLSNTPIEIKVYN